MAQNYFVYILTNKKKKTLYIGISNNLQRRVFEHFEDSQNEQKTFAGKYHCVHLVYNESFSSPNEAIKRETELKGWTRAKKNNLINSFNPDWKFLNDDFLN